MDLVGVGSMKRAIAAGLLLGATALAGEPSASRRDVTYHDGDIVMLSVQRGYLTVVEIPEVGVAALCGDCRFIDKDGVPTDSPGKWIVQLLHDTNKVSISALAPGASTNVNIMGTSGRLYSFALRETSQTRNQADLLVRIQAEGAVSNPIQQVRYVPQRDAENDKRRADEAERALDKQKAAADAQIAQARREAGEHAAASIRHDYSWNQNDKAGKTFQVTAIYSLDGFTVIEAHPQEAPALYEIRDGKDSLVQYTFEAGKYVVPKEINDGYLRVGKSKLTFHRGKRNV